MQRFDKDDRRDSNTFIENLFSSSVTGNLEKSDELFAEIKSFQSTFRQVQRTTDMLRRMMQTEFKFDGCVNGNKRNLSLQEERDLLRADWFPSTFVVCNYSNVEPWLDKALKEQASGKIVVMLVPSRTNTAWFHEKVLERAKEVRFVKGRVIFEGEEKAAAFPDTVVIFEGIMKPSKRKPQQQVGLICCTQFNQDGTDMAVTSVT